MLSISGRCYMLMLVLCIYHSFLWIHHLILSDVAYDYELAASVGRNRREALAWGLVRLAHADGSGAPAGQDWLVREDEVHDTDEIKP